MVCLDKTYKQSLLDYLECVQSDFKPPLFQRIIERSDEQTIENYVDKLLNNANVFAICGANNHIQGMIAIYTNNKDTLKAYIPILSVKKDFSGKGLAKILIDCAVESAINNGMKTVDVKTWPDNEKAISLYKKCGFTQIKEDVY